jgi:NitT/TauT family transport system ATP-binding protein
MIMENNQEIIRIENVTKVFRRGLTEITAVKDVNLTVNQNEFVAIIGPSGCGKTTLLRLIGDLTKPTSGKITIKGKTPEQARRDTDFGFVFQDPTLLPWRTVARNVQLPGEIFDDQKVKERTQELIELVGLKGFENALLSAVSSNRVSSS